MSDAAETFEYPPSQTIRLIALGFPETVEGSSCVNRAFAARGKNFVFLGEKENECSLRIKVESSRSEFEKHAANDPDRWQVGKAGWAMLRFAPDAPPSDLDLRRWITESFRLLAPKRLVNEFDDA